MGRWSGWSTPSPSPITPPAPSPHPTDASPPSRSRRSLQNEPCALLPPDLPRHHFLDVKRARSHRRADANTQTYANPPLTVTGLQELQRPKTQNRERPLVFAWVGWVTSIHPVHSSWRFGVVLNKSEGGSHLTNRNARRALAAALGGAVVPVSFLTLISPALVSATPTM